MFNYQEIIEQIDDNKVKMLLDKLGIPWVDKGAFLVCKTACHNIDLEEASDKLYFYKNKKLFVCFTSCGNLSIFKFLKNYYETREIEYDWYQDIYRVVLDCSNFNPENQFLVDRYIGIKDKYKFEKPKDLPIFDKAILSSFTKFYAPEWLNDGISKEAMDKYEILFSIPQNKIIIPHFNVNDELVGIRGRALNPEEVENYGKYAPVCIEKKWYSHPLSLNLYGLNKTKENIRKSGIAFIGESEKFCLQMEGFDRLNCSCASCGSNLNKYQIKLLMRECAPREIVVCYDREEIKGQEKYFMKLYKMCSKYKDYCNISFIYDREGLGKMKDSPTDNGEEIFETLLKERVKVK